MHRGFLADVMVENRNGKITFFEIAVSHKCSEEKIASGVEIFEIKIENMKSLELLKSMKFNELDIEHYNK